MQVARTQRVSRVAQAISMVQNLSSTDGFIRSSYFRFLLDGPKDIDGECGYPIWLTPDHYRIMYDREGIAARVVNCEPEETWAMDPIVFDDDDPEKDTAFEQAWDGIETSFNIWHYLQRADALSGIGQFGILLLGIDDGKDLREPVEGINDDGTVDEGNKYSLLYLRPFDESVVFVKVRETDTTNPRYSLPKIYTVQFRDYPNWGVQAGEVIARDIHWTRVIHLADNRKMSEVYGIPRMQQVYNRLVDLRKVYATSGEAFWKGGFPGLAFEVNPEVAEQGIPLDKESIRKEFEAFSNGTQRYLATEGVTTKTLPPMVVDPTPTVEVLLKAIAICKGVPFRVLFGSEEAKLAGTQDTRAWNKRLGKRQEKYVSPMVIRPFIDRLIAMGVLPETDEYFVEWPDLNAPTDKDKADIALTETQAMAAYVTSSVSMLMPPREYFTHVLGYTPDEADAIIEALNEYVTDEDEPLSQAGQDSHAQDQAEQQAAADGANQDNGDGENGVNGTSNDTEPATNARKRAKARKRAARVKVSKGELDEGGLGGANPDNGDALLMPNLSRRGMPNQVDPPMVSLPFIGNKRPVTNDRPRYRTSGRVKRVS